MKNSKLILNLLSVLLLASTAAALMLFTRFLLSGTGRFGFLLWNLFLAWVPMVLSLWFLHPESRFRPATTILIFLLWILFLPNTFYIVSDLVHLRAGGDINLLFDAVLLFSFSLIGMVLGYLSLGVVHTWLRRAVKPITSTLLIYLIILASSFAIYLGRYLRWNSWDIVANPLGLLVDVSDRFIAPSEHPRTLSTTLVFFVFISVGYTCIWRLLSYLRQGKKPILNI